MYIKSKLKKSLNFLDKFEKLVTELLLNWHKCVTKIHKWLWPKFGIRLWWIDIPDTWFQNFIYFFFENYFYRIIFDEKSAMLIEIYKLKWCQSTGWGDYNWRSTNRSGFRPAERGIMVLERILNENSWFRNDNDLFVQSSKF